MILAFLSPSPPPPPLVHSPAMSPVGKMRREMKFRILFLSLLQTFCSASTATDIPLGSTLFASKPNQTWLSPSKTFSLGFLPINASAFSLAITYGSNIPIWKAGGESAVADAGASFSLLPSGDLRLTSGSGRVLWRSDTSGIGVSRATLDDSGNLSLLKGGSGSAPTPVWSTFDNPTDTVVPSQSFPVGKVLTSGLYSSFLNKTGNLTLQWNNSQVYWSTGLNSSVNSNLSNPHLDLRSNGIFTVSDDNIKSGPVILAYSSDFGDSGVDFRFLKLDNDGNLRIYRSIRGSETAAVRWSAVSDQCLVPGYCGNMGICSYNASGPVCGCPSENFDPVDANDSRKGCKLKKEIDDCQGSASILQLDHTRFLVYPPDSLNPVDIFTLQSSACRDNCLVSGACIASTSFGDGSAHCYMAYAFASGYQSPAVSSTSYVKVCNPVLSNPTPPALEARENKKVKGGILAAVVLGALLVFVVLECGFWWFCCRNRSNVGSMSAQSALIEYASGAPVQFSYKHLRQATRGFKEKLGEGGFGAVYRGVLPNKTVVAVKQLEGIDQGERQFRMEVATISSTHHLNLVRLMGFCSEGKRRLLVYEFMRNGSLESFLSSPSERESERVLSWEQRFSIALGAAKGITYLHEECRDCIVHCDIKPENILLDENYAARVSDFGLARLVNPKDHRDRTLRSTVRGTRGYLAPEWLANLPITSKSDVYSYGMVLLEIVSGRRNFEVSSETGGKRFSAWAYEEFFDKGNVSSIVDKRLADSEVDVEQAGRAIRVSFWCIQEQPSQRPTMGKAVQMLEGITEVEKPPAVTSACEATVCGSSENASLSACAVSGPSPTSSLQTSRAVSCASGMNVETPISSVLERDEKIEAAELAYCHTEPDPSGGSS